MIVPYQEDAKISNTKKLQEVPTSLALIPLKDPFFVSIEKCSGLANAFGAVYYDDGLTVTSKVNKIGFMASINEQLGIDITFCLGLIEGSLFHKEEMLQYVYIIDAEFAGLATTNLKATITMKDSTVVTLPPPTYDNFKLTVDCDSAKHSLLDIAQISINPQ